MPQPVGVRPHRRRHGRKDHRPQGVKVGRKGLVFMYRGGVKVKALTEAQVLSAVGRKVWDKFATIDGVEPVSDGRFFVAMIEDWESAKF